MSPSGHLLTHHEGVSVSSWQGSSFEILTLGAFVVVLDSKGTPPTSFATTIAVNSTRELSKAATRDFT